VCAMHSRNGVDVTERAETRTSEVLRLVVGFAYGDGTGLSVDCGCEIMRVGWWKDAFPWNLLGF
jgi:hypothetical protein